MSGDPMTPAGGDGSTALLYATEPLSFWGGYDAETGEIIDRRHPLSGEIAAGRALALPSTRGSSTTTAVLLEAIRRGTAPAALITRGRDSFLMLAAVVAEELYGARLPVVAVDEATFAELAAASRVSISPDGSVETAR